MKLRNSKLSVMLGAMMLILCEPVLTEQSYVDILAALAKKERKTVRFEERQEAFYLDAPLISAGIMRFEPPDKLIKIINEPEHIVQQIEGDVVSVTWGDNRTEQFSIAMHNGLHSVTNTLISFLSGDVKYIDSNYTVEYSIKQEAWELVLIPKDENISKWIKSIEAKGVDSNIRRFTVIEVNGDHTTTIFYDE